MRITSLFLSLCLSTSAFATKAEYIDYLPDPINHELLTVVKQNIPNTTPQDIKAIKELGRQMPQVKLDVWESLASQEEGNELFDIEGLREGRVCVSRCTGSGSDQVCYEVCYEN